ncbi:T3SS effector HopA1 family protein [Streptomyces sp. L2]|uniref:T3SS effector HopA1 family protein n=1 Tax=Streptomyces sp. L2 TaxID=2162665 RepID=UPI0010110CE2|nr:T3SS effector HopA1 family protein [Streptomyces sp. L2]
MVTDAGHGAFRDRLRLIYDEVRIDDGTIVHSRLGRLRESPDMEAKGAPLLSHLWRLIYLCYHAGDERASRLLVDGSRATTPIHGWEEPEAVARMEAAHASRWTLSRGWTVVDRGAVIRATRSGVHLLCRPQEVDGDQADGDGQVALRMPATQRYTLSGWLVLHGELGSGRPDHVFVRHYLSLHDVGSAARAIRTLSAKLNQARVRHHIKVANNAMSLRRRDAFILYSEEPSAPLVEPVVRDVVESGLVDASYTMPLFAEQVLPGWSTAVESRHQDPSLSYGQACARATSLGVIEAGERGARTFADWYAAVSEQFEASGIGPSPSPSPSHRPGGAP